MLTLDSSPARTPDLIRELQTIWLQSVRATHDFLTADDIEALLPDVQQALYEIPMLVIACQDHRPVAFLGINGTKVEMLFAAPSHIGQGIGRALITHAIQRFGCTRVDVNEQNPAAARFYHRMGFEVFDRSPLDEQGRPFPILKMKLLNTKQTAK